jgi:cysteine synthase
LRSTELLQAAARTLEDGCNPFETSWLVEHEVTIDEVYDLSDQLALGARMLLAARKGLTSGHSNPMAAAAILAGITEGL